MTLCERMKEVRTDKDIGQKELAAALGITQQQYSLYETGHRKIPGEMLGALCLFLGVSADYLLGLPKDLKWPR